MAETGVDLRKKDLSYVCPADYGVSRNDVAGTSRFCRMIASNFVGLSAEGLGPSKAGIG